MPRITYRVPPTACHVRRTACHVSSAVFDGLRASHRILNVGLALFLSLVIVVGGCSSSKEVKDEDAFYLAAFEDFDPDEHPDVVLPPPPREADHSIPEALMTPGDDAGIVKIRGYRVQLFASRDKNEADGQLQRAIAWWERHRHDDLSRDQPPIYLEYEQPYYKVRLGDYRTRQNAALDADRLARIFRGAFVVPAWVNPE